MRAGIVVNVTPGDRRRLEAIVGNRDAPQKHVWRAEIILATDEGCGPAEIMRRSGKVRPVVWRWQARFMAEGVARLARDKTRKPGKPPLPVAACGGWSCSPTLPRSSMLRLLQLRDASHFLLQVGHDDSRHVEHTHAQFLWFRREPWRCTQNSLRGGRPLLPQPLH